MPIWVMAVILIASMALSYLIRPKQPAPAKPASLGDFNFPTATSVRPLPVIVGSVLHKGPNCIWDGDLKSEKIYQKVPNPLTFGLTKSKTFNGQYSYYVGMDLLLCHGGDSSDVKLRLFNVGEKTVWTGSISSGSLSFNLPQLFGGPQQGGGYAGTFHFFKGDWTQTRDAYLVAQNPTAIVSHQRGLCHLLQLGPSSGDIGGGLHNGYVGNSASLQAYSFVLSRIPDHLGQTAYTAINSQTFNVTVYTGDGSTTADVSITLQDANPIEWLYEVLTNPRYGMGVDPAKIDLAAFQSAGHTCFSEGLGLSVLWDTQRNIEDVINDITSLVDGACFVDRTTGLWTVKLARDDYDHGSLFEFNESNILEYIDFSVNTLDETPNFTFVKYVRKEAKFTNDLVSFRDPANRRVQGATIPTPAQDFYGLSFQTEAQQIAFRVQRVSSLNLRKATFKVNRQAHWVRPLSVFSFARHSVGIDSIIMRCISINDGALIDGEIEIVAVQDVFGLGSSKYAPIPATRWKLPVHTPAVIGSSLVMEAPYFFSGNAQQAISLAAPADDTYIDYDFEVSVDGAISESREKDCPFTPVASLASAYDALTSALDASHSLVITPIWGIGQLTSATADEVTAGSNLILFASTGEFAAFQDITDNGDGTFTLNNVWRALNGSSRSTHAIGELVWFMSYGLGQTLGDDFDNATVLTIKQLTRTMQGILSLAAATPQSLTIVGRGSTPYVPGNIRVQGSVSPTTPSYTQSGVQGDLTVYWSHRDRTQQDTIIVDSTTDIGPEPGVTYTVKFYNHLTSALLHTYTNVIGNSIAYSEAQEIADNGGVLTSQLRVEIQAFRGTVASWTTAKRLINPRTA